MNKTFIAATAAITFLATPALADEARTSASEPFYAPQSAMCDSVDLKVYFEKGEAELTSFARDAIRETREQLAGCAVTDLDAVAIATDASTETDKQSLAEARRISVLQEFSMQGIQSRNSDFRTDVSASEDDAIMARRVDIQLKAEPAMAG